MMGGIQVGIFVESRYKVNRKRIQSTIINLLGKHEIKGPVEVSVAVIGNRKMRELSKKYKGEDKAPDVLSFSLIEGETTYLPQDVLRLGDIVLSYPEVIKQASEEETFVDDKIDEFIEYGLEHLLGINHE
jgi:rRNA maturation RNase YbeY